MEKAERGPHPAEFRCLEAGGRRLRASAERGRAALAVAMRTVVAPGTGIPGGDRDRASSHLSPAEEEFSNYLAAAAVSIENAAPETVERRRPTS